MTATTANPDFEALLDYLKRNRGFDFTGYKRASLIRRINKRMQAVGIDQYLEYMDHLEVHPDEFISLFNTILINVTGFFRDSSTWDYLAKEILPRLLQDRLPGEPVRVWSAGTASGEEAYTIAMLLAEAMGPQDFRQRVKIYATDVDEDGLRQARAALYSARQAEDIPPHLLDRYFQRAGSGFVFDPELRRSVIFGRHDLIQDAPISRVDLLICRNVLMYFNAETQKKILSRLHFALRDQGYLFLGKAESLLSHNNLFIPLETRHHFLTKESRISLRDRLMVMAQNGEEGSTQLASQVRLREAAFETAPVAQIVLDALRQLAMVNTRARILFGLSSADLGRLFQDLELSYHPVDLRSALDQAFEQRKPVELREIDWSGAAANQRVLDVQIFPLLENGGNLIGANLTFTDVSVYKKLQQQLEHSNQELETTMEELQSTNEELETTNEELQSTIEELETTNEELQSTNEELETMNEELQSTNQEMEALNEELRQRIRSYNRVNNFLQSILANLRSGVIVLDAEMRIQVWNQKSEDLWGLRSDEVFERHFMDLDIGLPVEKLKRLIRESLAGKLDGHQITLEARNRRGQYIRCQVNCVPIVDSSDKVQGVILMVNDSPLSE
jgi:two-component system CheB/CheR fusion protein